MLKAFKNVPATLNEKIAMATKLDGSKIFVNYVGTDITPPGTEAVSNFSEGFGVVKSIFNDYPYEYVNKHGVCAQERYRKASPIKNGLAITQDLNSFENQVVSGIHTINDPRSAKVLFKTSDDIKGINGNVVLIPGYNYNLSTKQLLNKDKSQVFKELGNGYFITRYNTTDLTYVDENGVPAEEIFENNPALEKVDGENVYCSIADKSLIFPYCFFEIKPFSNGRAKVVFDYNGKSLTTYINELLVVSPNNLAINLANAYDYNEEFALVSKINSTGQQIWGLMDKSSNIRPFSSSISPVVINEQVTNGHVCMYDNKDDCCYFYNIDMEKVEDKDGNVLKSSHYSEFNKSGFLTYRDKSGISHLFNSSSKEDISLPKDIKIYLDGNTNKSKLFRFSRLENDDEKFGYLDECGRVVIERLVDTEPFNENNIAKVTLDYNLQTYMDQNGNLMGEHNYNPDVEHKLTKKNPKIKNFENYVEKNGFSTDGKFIYPDQVRDYFTEDNDDTNTNLTTTIIDPTDSTVDDENLNEHLTERDKEILETIDEESKKSSSEENSVTPTLKKAKPVLKPSATPMGRLERLTAGKTSDVVELTATEKIKTWIDSGESVLLRGPSGIGKTERIKSLYPDLVYIKLTNNMFPEKVVGSMNLQTGENIPPAYAKELLTRYASPEEKEEIEKNINYLYECAEEIYERSKSAEGKCVILLDELLNVKPAVQSLVYSLVLNKIVESGSGLKLPANTVVVATGNQKKYSSVAEDLAEPLEKRFDHIYDMEPKVKEWLEEYAIPKQLHPSVVGYIASKYNEHNESEKLKDIPYFYEEPEVGEKHLDKNGCNGRTNDPRSWVSVSKALYNFEENLQSGKFSGMNVENILEQTLSTKLRDAWASEFYNFYNNPILTVEDIVDKNYTPADTPSTLNEKFAQVYGLLSADEESMPAVKDFIRKECSPEYLELFESYITAKNERVDINDNTSKVLESNEKENLIVLDSKDLTDNFEVNTNVDLDM